VELAGLAGDALADDPGVLVDEDAHGSMFLTPAATTFLAASAEAVGRDDRRCRLAARIFLPVLHVRCPRARTTSGTVKLDGLRRRRRGPSAIVVAPHDAAEDVDEDRLHLRVGEDDA